jgi:hypothetical protein
MKPNINSVPGVVYFQLSGVAKLVNIHKEYLAKFGYRPNMNFFFKKRILLYFCYFWEPVVKIWQFFFYKSEIDKLEPIFPPKSFVPLCGHHISQVEKMPKFSKIKKTLLHSLHYLNSRSLKHAKAKEPVRMAGLGFIQNLLIIGIQWMDVLVTCWFTPATLGAGRFELLTN